MDTLLGLGKEFLVIVLSCYFVNFYITNFRKKVSPLVCNIIYVFLLPLFFLYIFSELSGFLGGILLFLIGSFIPTLTLLLASKVVADIIKNNSKKTNIKIYLLYFVGAFLILGFLVSGSWRLVTHINPKTSIEYNPEYQDKKIIGQFSIITSDGKLTYWSLPYPTVGGNEGCGCIYYEAPRDLNSKIKSIYGKGSVSWTNPDYINDIDGVITDILQIDYKIEDDDSLTITATIYERLAKPRVTSDDSWIAKLTITNLPKTYLYDSKCTTYRTKPGNDGIPTCMIEEFRYDNLFANNISKVLPMMNVAKEIHDFYIGVSKKMLYKRKSFVEEYTEQYGDNFK